MSRKHFTPKVDVTVTVWSSTSNFKVLFNIVYRNYFAFLTVEDLNNSMHVYEGNAVVTWCDVSDALGNVL